MRTYTLNVVGSTYAKMLDFVIYDEDGDQIVVLPVPMDADALPDDAALIQFARLLVVFNADSFQSGVDYGKTALQNDLRKLLGVN
jgi:hypothetical protein